MKIYNPTNQTISIQHKGNTFTIDGLSSLNYVPKETAEYWKESIHNFIVLSHDTIEDVKIEDAVKDNISSENISSEDIAPMVEEPKAAPKKSPIKLKK